VCDVVIHNQHICPGCIGSNKNDTKLTQFQSRRIMHDNITMMLALTPLVFGWLGVLVAPAALVYGIIRWRAPGSLVPRSKVRFVLAMLVALLSILGVGSIIVAMILG